METFSMIAALLGLWFGAVVVVSWIFCQWAKAQEEQPIELKEEWVVDEIKT
ncbi:MAG: hypothetical protein UY28_C0004G0004 [Candidatus Amesbacteria bacterium GW2011_GWB1_48_13]|uniref:Uncharacterized protein n=1 Tax=Candidatus Amesbacteria bacterium GW2011_GWB1_48_13 TaxID=1618362 RepID=A0A0G1UW38_9BACT|nr:MAG: hypothetical protein UY28_C0004G0004 [Candidatus Amesbacteria bacterium GW2011_GWB1_48_13]